MFYGIDPVRYVVAFVAIIALMAGAFYLLRRFGAGALASGSVRGRQPRLAVIESAAVDQRRSLLLIRRDNVEHLIMIGGPSDVVIEPNIVRGIPTAPAREAPPPRAADILPRAMPLGEGSMWPAQPEAISRAPRAAPPVAPLPVPQTDEQGADWSEAAEPAPRVVPDSEPRGAEREPRMPAERELRIAAEREPRIAAERGPRVVAEREPRVAAEREPRVVAEREPRVAAEREPRAAAEREPPATPPPAPRTSENSMRMQNSERLSGLAADLSRSFLDPDAPPPPPRRSAEARRAPPAAPPPLQVSESEEQNLTEMAQRLESALQRPRQVTPPTAEPPPTPRAVEVVRAEPTGPQREARAGASGAKPATKPGFDNLEQEMASLLGRPSGKS
ncbi:MAG TPA: flagellar biosynthetic protein FliO [Xanthobacteraceae bacterium]|nr:flagellar biosynthetic protein FliO [Xanthobacteraceae bacterium]